MMHSSASTVQRMGFSRRSAFTIIELLTVITIILILAGLILGIAGHAQGKAARSRAEGEIQALSAAANNYQIDNGTYPRVARGGAAGSKNTDDLDAQKAYDPAGTSSPAYKDTSLILYQLLGGAYYIDTNGTPKQWTSSGTVAKPTLYFPFKDSQLQNTGNVTSGYIDPTTVTAIVDPFGFSYGYSTAYQAAIERDSTQTPTVGYNPTFDLWSTAGYSSSGKPYPSKGPGSTATEYNTLWVKNW